MKILIVLCLFLLELSSTNAHRNEPYRFNGINYHYINSSSIIKSDSNLTYCEYNYDDKDKSKLILILDNNQTPKKIGFNCDASRYECCELRCCLTTEAEFLAGVEKMWFLLKVFIFLIVVFFVVAILLFIVDTCKNPEIRNEFLELVREIPRRCQRDHDNVSVHTMETDISTVKDSCSVNLTLPVLSFKN